MLAEPVDQADRVQPGLVPHPQAVRVGEIDRVQRLAVDVELQLAGRAVADPHRARSPVALEMVEDLLVEVGRPVDAVHDLKRRRPFRGLLDPGVEPLQKRPRLVGEAQTEQRVHRERRVAYPGEPVVPVALAADLLGQRRGRRGDQGAGRGVRHELERHRRPLDHFPPPPRVAGAADPSTPEVAGLLEQVQDLVGRDDRAVGPSGAVSSTRPPMSPASSVAKARTPCSVRTRSLGRRDRRSWRDAFTFIVMVGLRKVAPSAPTRPRRRPDRS